ncbi:MAG TPA: 2Fe-2S iron-sulfur cluster-binding protein, partial [Burkholderiaceae bacterium]|nr:2Fe-2S iron-sulfur cluster-binding protein [Burkholderiaceae bacterium]
MFAPLPEAERTAVTVTIDGRAHAARAGDSVAAALLAAGVVRFRASAASGAPRGP